MQCAGVGAQEGPHSPWAHFPWIIPALARFWQLLSPVGASPPPRGDKAEPRTLPVSWMRD